MAEFPFNWQLQPTGSLHSKFNNHYTSSHKINSEWTVVCLWRPVQRSIAYAPEFLKIRRNSTAKEILVSGTFELCNGSRCLHKRKFVQLIEANIASTLLYLDRCGNCEYYGGSYSLIGTLKIPAGASDLQIPAIDRQKECAKGVHIESLLNLSTNFECLLDAKENYFSDVNLKCEAVSFSAHKSILSARSLVFTAMFKTEMKENRNNKVDIKDISPQILKTMLTYIYTAKTGELSAQTAGELLFAADKYQLQDLKRVCSDYLKTCVSAENVLNILVLGYLHDGNLKDFAMDFICTSIEEFEVMEKTEEWKNLQQERPTLAMDVLTCLVKSKDKVLKERRY